MTLNSLIYVQIIYKIVVISFSKFYLTLLSQFSRIISSDTLPDCVRLGDSRISGHGVFTNYRLHEGTIFGPYKGKHQDGSIDKSAIDTSYFWAVRIYTISSTL